MTNRCEFLKSGISQQGDSTVRCVGNLDGCPKNRIKLSVSQACWQVRKGLDAVLDGGE